MPLSPRRRPPRRCARSQLRTGLGRIRIWQSPDEGWLQGLYLPGFGYSAQYSWRPEPEAGRYQAGVRHDEVLRISTDPVLLHVPEHALFYALRLGSGAPQAAPERDQGGVSADVEFSGA